MRRLIQFVVVLWGAATLNFLVPRLAPGNPVRERLMTAMQQPGPSQQGIEEMVRSYNVQFAAGRILTPSLDEGTLTVLDVDGRVRERVRVAPSSHDACLAYS